MKEITKYFRNAVAASSQETLEYKDGEFYTITLAELEEGLISEGANEFLWKKDSDFETLGDTKTIVRSVIIALKTITTEFTDSMRIEENLEEMTSIFYLPVNINQRGYISLQEEGRMPWIPREYLYPMEEPQIVVGTVEKYDEYLETTTDARNQIATWSDYLRYAINMYEFVTESKFAEKFVYCENEKIETDGKYYLFLDTMVIATGHIMQLYNHLQNDKENSLYTKLTNGKTEPSKKLFLNTDVNKMKNHVGQMSGEYPLSPSQRETINHFEAIGEGDILAVSGPPGTGKTTLLQSIVSNMYVDAALKRKDAPIIVATSTNNKAVTNIIDSFGKISGVGLANLEERWITGVNSFATYFPSNGKIYEARKNGYQYTNVRGEVFVEELESTENRKKATKYFKEKYAEYFEGSENELSDCKNKLFGKLDAIDRHRVKCLSLMEDIKEVLKEDSYENYIENLIKRIKKEEQTIQDATDRIEHNKIQIKEYLNRCMEWRNSYNKLPWYVRLLKFLPYFKNRILMWSFSFINENELSFLKRDMRINDIEKTYWEKINATDNESTCLTDKREVSFTKREKLNLRKDEIEKQMENIKRNFHLFDEYQIMLEKEKEIKIWNRFDVEEINNLLDKVRYVEFWLAVHCYECRWLLESNPISDKQKGKNFEKVLKTMYHRMAMISPCMVMTFFLLPKQFLAYNTNEKKNYYMYNYIDLLIVDEAGQTSPEIAAPAFSLAKKAVVVGDEKQISPIYGTTKALDISMAISNNVIRNKQEYTILEASGLNCSQSSIMKLATLSCAFDKYQKGLFLCEHRRCYNEIIAYCNRLVYGDKLEPLRGNAMDDKRNAIAGLLPAMGHKQITVAKSQKNGTSRSNMEEAKQIVSWLNENYLKILECYKKNENSLTEKEVIGIITPFKSQSTILRRMIKRNMPQYADSIDVGTVHTFQGAERKVILFSSVYGNTDGCYFINIHQSLMNVAVSRAQDAFLVFGDRGCLVGGEKSAAVLLKQMTEKSIN